MRFPSGSVITNVRPKTSSCGSSTTWTPFETQFVKVSSTADAGPGTMSPASHVRGVPGTVCSLRPVHSANRTPGATSNEAPWA